MNNQYASQYLIAYNHGTQTQDKIIQLKNSPTAKQSEIENLEEKLKRWKKEADSLYILAKNEENKLKKQNKTNGLGNKIDFLA